MESDQSDDSISESSEISDDESDAEPDDAELDAESDEESHSDEELDAQSEEGSKTESFEQADTRSKKSASKGTKPAEKQKRILFMKLIIKSDIPLTITLERGI